MPLNEYTLERLADLWIDRLKDSGRQEAWRVYHGEIGLTEVKQKERENVEYFFNELALCGGADNVQETFDEVFAKAKRKIAKRGK